MHNGKRHIPTWFKGSKKRRLFNAFQGGKYRLIQMESPMMSASKEHNATEMPSFLRSLVYDHQQSLNDFGLTLHLLPFGHSPFPNGQILQQTVIAIVLICYYCHVLLWRLFFLERTSDYFRNHNVSATQINIPNKCIFFFWSKAIFKKSDVGVREQESENYSQSGFVNKIRNSLSLDTATTHC